MKSRRRKNLGEVDIVVLHDIYKHACRLEKEFNWGYHFEVDSGGFETMLAFHKGGNLTVPNIIIQNMHPDTIKRKYKVLVPDIIDYSNKVIIEYEEESEPMKGPKIRKRGHWEESKHDAERDLYYHNAGYTVLKIWENEYNRDVWKPKVKEFLMETFRSKIKTPQ